MMDKVYGLFATSMVLCFTETSAQVEGDVRLRGNGSTASQGRVEVFHNNIWGTVCDDQFTNHAAIVVCRQLGLVAGSAHAKPVDPKVFGPGTGKIWLDDTNCFATEQRLIDCMFNNWNNDCEHTEDVGVICPVETTTTRKPVQTTTTAIPAHSCNRGQHCDFLTSGVFNQTLHYPIGDKIQITVWCTSPIDFTGNRHPRLSARSRNYNFLDHQNDRDSGFTVVQLQEKTDDGHELFNATTTLTIDPALMIYENERIESTMPVGKTRLQILLWFYLDIVQLKHESQGVTVPVSCPNVTLYCEMEYPVVHHHDPIYVWKHASKTLVDGDKYKIQDNGILIINDLTLDDVGTYMCSMHYEEDTDVVTKQRTPSRVQLTLVDHESDEEVELGECHLVKVARGKPPITSKPSPTTKSPKTNNEKIADILDMVLIGAMLLAVAAIIGIAIGRSCKKPKATRTFAPAPAHDPNHTMQV